MGWKKVWNKKWKRDERVVNKRVVDKKGIFWYIYFLFLWDF